MQTRVVSDGNAYSLDWVSSSASEMETEMYFFGCGLDDCLRRSERRQPANEETGQSKQTNCAPDGNFTTRTLF